MRFDLTDLRLFVAIATAGSITRGAAEVGLSVAAASERLRSMETDSKIILLDRRPRGAAPTEAGIALLHHARSILHQMAMLKDELGEYAADVRATVRIWANTASITEYLPERLASWMAAHPQADIELRERQSAEVAKGVASGFADLGVLSEAVDLHGLELYPFAVDRLVAVVPRERFLDSRDRISFVDLTDQHFVGLSNGALQEHVDIQASLLGAPLKYRAKLPTLDGVCRMVAEGAGVAIVPKKTAVRLRRSLKLAVILLSDPWATRRLSICTSIERELTPLAEGLIEHLSVGPRRKCFSPAPD
jgi:molybdate transport repressor ModE-like protein